MRLAIIADWLTTFGGAEHTIAEFRTLWPDAPLYTTVAKRERLGPLADAEIHVTKLQKLYSLIARHEPLLPFMPRALEGFDLTGYDAILSSSHAVAKGIIPPQNAAHVCYCHTPMRYAWEMENQYLNDFRVPKILRRRLKLMLRSLRRWDLSTSRRVDAFIANSRETQSRIERIYGREATVVSPPVHDRFLAAPLTPHEKRGGYLAVGRFVPYKRFDLLIEWANATGETLTIAGRGQEDARLRRMAGPTVKFLGYVPDADLPALYGSAKAFLFPAYEDAGIVPLEAQSAGTPVIALGKGGALDAVRDGETGLFFDTQTVDAIRDAVKRFETTTFNPEKIRAHAATFSSVRFRETVKNIVEKTAEKKLRVNSQLAISN